MPDHRRWLFTKKCSDSIDTITPDIHQAPSAHSWLKPHVFGFQIKGKPKGSSYHPRYSDRSLSQEFLNLQSLWMKAIHEGFHQQTMVSFGRINHLPGLGGTICQWLFTQNMFSCLKSANGPRAVQMVWERNVNHINIRVLQQRGIASIAIRESVLPGKGLCLWKSPARYGVRLRIF